MKDEPKGASPPSDSDLVVIALRDQFPERPPPAGPPDWPDHPAFHVIGAVLSLRRNYRKFVIPRVRGFAASQPNCTTLRSLRHLVQSYDSPVEFSATELDCRDGHKVEIMAGVTDYLLEVIKDQDGKTELHRLRAWAAEAHPGDYIEVGVKGFGLSGFQYLRMLFGAQTAKPDRHIQSFVQDAVGHEVTDVQALVLLSRAASRVGLPLRDVDAAIWQEGAGT